MKRSSFRSTTRQIAARSKKVSGLGLSICQRLVQNLGGQIGYDPRRETQFWFTLPQDLSSAPWLEQEESGKEASGEPQKQNAQNKPGTGSAFSSPYSARCCSCSSYRWLQALALGWIYTNMEAASRVLVRSSASETSGTSRIWLNAFNGGYSAALYLAQDGR
ncbi:MAG: hypothetical protein IPM93_25065 [Candidatus Obscuribacter sp.]|nr:hypothetical protein [Candidatus Obscuribacter sp.]